MKIYNYTKQKDKLIFVKESEARPNPLKRNEFLMPANSTTKKPPNFTEKQIPVLENDEWVLIDNFVGETWYEKNTGNEVIIKDFGKPNDNLTSVKYTGKHYYWNKTENKWKLDSKGKLSEEIKVLKNSSLIMLEKTLSEKLLENNTITFKSNKFKVSIEKINAMMRSVMFIDNDVEDSRIQNNIMSQDGVYHKFSKEDLLKLSYLMTQTLDVIQNKYEYLVEKIKSNNTKTKQKSWNTALKTGEWDSIE